MMLSEAKNILLAILSCCICVQASQRCGVSALHDRVMTAAEKYMESFLLFRGEITKIQQEAPPEAGCCVGADCISVQCASPDLGKNGPTPEVHVDYTVNETIWGNAGKTIIHEAVQLPSQCDSFKPTLHGKVHEKVIAFCSVFSGWPEDGSMFCDTPIADTEENVREARGWIPLAIRRQQRDKVSEEEARTHLIHKVKPVYPKVDGPPGKPSPKGDVVVRLFIDKIGDVQSISAIRGPQELRQSAINAASLWRYKPFRAGGRPVKVDTTVTVHF
jgi:hypothetical protein